MPRTARVAPKEHVYHVLTRGNNRQDVDEHPVYPQLFGEERERRKKYREFVRGMLKEKEAMKADSVWWCGFRERYGDEL